MPDLYPWAPDTSRVAAYVTARTAEYETPHLTRPAEDFSDSTVPSDRQVQLLITDACAWVIAGLSRPLASGLTAATVLGYATSCAALRAAGLVEAAYLRSVDTVNMAELWLREATQMLAQLDSANNDWWLGVAGATEAGSEDELLPVGYFPEPLRWGDVTL